MFVCEGIMQYVIKLDYIFEEQRFIVFLQDFKFEGGLED